MNKLNDKFVSVMVSAAATSMVTHSDFLKTVALIGATTFVQTAASSLGNDIARMHDKEEVRRNLEKRKNIFTELQQSAQKSEASFVPNSVDLHSPEINPDRVKHARLEAQQLKQGNQKHLAKGKNLGYLQKSAAAQGKKPTVRTSQYSVKRPTFTKNSRSPDTTMHLHAIH